MDGDITASFTFSMAPETTLVHDPVAGQLAHDIDGGVSIGLRGSSPGSTIGVSRGGVDGKVDAGTTGTAS